MTAKNIRLECWAKLSKENVVGIRLAYFYQEELESSNKLYLVEKLRCDDTERRYRKTKFISAAVREDFLGILLWL